MIRSRFRLPAAFAVAVIALTPQAAAVVAATPGDTGCPASTQLYSVAWLESQGPYRLPGRLDDPANGGNGDGYVCAFPLPDAVSTAKDRPFTIYQFFEDNLPAEGAA